MAGGGFTPRRPWMLVAEEQGVEDNGLSEGHADQTDRNDLAERAGIASHRFGSLHSDQTHTDGGTQAGQADLNAAVHLCQHWRYHNCLSLLCFLRRLPQLNTVKPPKFEISVM